MVWYCIVLYSIVLCSIVFYLTSHLLRNPFLIFIFAFPRWHFLLFLKPLQQQLILNFFPLGYFNNCPVLRVPGRVYPVDIYHSKMQQTMTLRGPSNTSYVQVLYISNFYLLFTFFCLICAIWHLIILSSLSMNLFVSSVAWLSSLFSLFSSLVCLLLC